MYVDEYLQSAGYSINEFSESDYSYFFYYLSRSEELNTTEKCNGHNWELHFASTERQELRHNIILEEQAEQLCAKGGLTREKSIETRWPKGAPFALCLTHDVDLIHNNLWRERMRLLANLDDAPSVHIKLVSVASALVHFAKKLLHPNSINQYALNNWMEIERQFGFSSTFYFVPYPCPPHSFEDTFYRLDDTVEFANKKTTVGEMMKEVYNSGWDVGLHGSTHSCNDSNLLHKQRLMISDAIGEEARSIRQHHLVYDVRTSPAAQSQAGLFIDTSLGCNYGTGFRCGTSLPFRMFDLKQNKPLPIVEIPTTVQDVSIHRDLENDEALVVQHVLNLMDRVQAVGGVMTLLWHNNSPINSPMYNTYRAILEEASSRGAWGCNVRQLESWWRENHLTDPWGTHDSMEQLQHG